jgi:hypothetical protein
MLVLNSLLLNREYNLMNLLKALASIVSTCSPRVILLSKIAPRYFTLFTSGALLVMPNRHKCEVGKVLDVAQHCSIYSAASDIY